MTPPARSACRAVLVGLPILWAAFAPAATTADPRVVLFVDDHDVARRTGIERVVNQATPSPEPVIAPDDPRTQTDCGWGSVIREPDGRFRLWYCTMIMGDRAGGPHEMARAGVWGRGDDWAFHPRSAADVVETETMLGRYAESVDGLTWTKPRLGLVDVGDGSLGNVVLTGAAAARQTDGLLTNFDGYSVLRDDAEPDAARRYKMIAHWESVHCWDNHEASGLLGRPAERIARHWEARGPYLMTSPDGLRWSGPLERLDTLPTGGGDRLLVVPDGLAGGWMAYVRTAGWRHPSFTTSPNLVAWSSAEAAASITPDTVGLPAVECMIPFAYAGQYLGFPCGMDKPRGLFTVLLASRRPAGDWEWVERTRPFIAPGPPGSYHASGAVPLHAEPFLVGERLLVFFNAFSRDPAHPCRFGSRSIGVATLRRDGFVGFRAADPATPGRLVTRPLETRGTRLAINVEQRGAGEVRVAVVDESEAERPGFGLADALPITGDGTRLPLRWRGGDVLPEGGPVRLLVEVRGAAIVYAVAWDDG